MSAFAHALRSRAGDALQFLDAPPVDDAGWSALLARTAAAAPRVPLELAEMLAERQALLGAGPRAVANALALADGEQRALAVVTGQQPGLLGGPLLTFHKAAGAIALAKRLDGLDGRRVVPVFWLASEDHDFDEANRALVIDRAGQARTLKLAMEGDGRSLMDLDVPTELSAALATQLAEALPETERSLAAQALATRQDGETLAAWSARILTALFGDTGLVIVEPPVLLPWVGETYGWLLDHAETIRAAVHEAGAALEAAGLPAPLFPQPEGATALFYRPSPGAPRLRVGLGDEEPLLRGEPAGMSRAALREMLVKHPERGSGNVIGRVFVQNRHLPTVAYVAGPTEIAYQAQLRSAYQALDAFFPLAIPRPEATWVDAKTRAALATFDLVPAEVLQDHPAGPKDDPAFEDDLATVRAYLDGLEAHAEALGQRGGQAREALARAFDRTRKAWAKAEPAVRAAFERDAGVERGRYARALALLRPNGKGQDRLLSPLSLVARHGLAAVQKGLASLDSLTPAHHLVHLEDAAPPRKDPAS